MKKTNNLDKTNLFKKKKRQLKRMCQERKLKIAGNKKTLVLRQMKSNIRKKKTFVIYLQQIIYFSEIIPARLIIE